MGQKSAAIQEVASNGRVRMQSVRCGLKKAVRTQQLSDVFRDMALRIGATRHVVSLIANAMVLRYGASNIESWYKFYNNIWSAVEYLVNPAGLKSNNPYIDDMRDVIERFPTLIDRLKNVVPERCPSHIRLKAVFDMGTAAEEHLAAFEERLNAYTVVRVVEILKDHNAYTKDLSDAIVKRTKTFILSETSKADASMLSNDLLHKLKVSTEVTQSLVAWVLHERELLGELVNSTDYRERWQYVSKSKSKSWKFVSHLMRYSTHMTTLVQDDQILLHLLHEESDESGAPVEDLIRQHRTWSRSVKPRPFSILPIFKLQAGMVYYGYTEIDCLYSYIYREEMTLYTESNPKPTRKRKNDESVLNDALRQWENNAPQRFTPDKLDFSKTIFRDKLPITKKLRGERLLCFRTDGVKLCLTFATNDIAPDGIKDLVEKGYSSVPVCDGVDVSSEERGLWHITQYNGGTLTCTEDKTIDIRCVDPGLHKPVEWSCLPSDSGSTVSDLSKNATFDHISEATWMRLSGREERNAWEERRRSTNKDYKSALDVLSTTMRHSADFDVFGEYVVACGDTLRTRFDELCHRRRSLRNWMWDRRSQSFLSRMANRIAGRESVKNRSTTSLCSSSMTPDELEALRQRAKAARLKRKEGRKTVVFFGDGEFNHAQKHHVSIPKKSILHEIGSRVPTILIDEFKTSQKCVCGAMLCNQSDDTGCRVRVHQDGGDCDALRCGICDRDELATLNIALASLACIANRPWPLHLQR